MSVTIDPRRHDAVLFALDTTDSDSAAELLRQLRGAGVAFRELHHTENSDPLTKAAGLLNTRPGRCVVIADSQSAVTAAHEGGFALVVGVDDLHEIAVRTGDRPMSELPDAMDVLATLLDGTGNALQDPAVFFDFDGTLSDIVDDPDAARLTVGAAEALRSLTARCPVAVLSGRDLADVRQRVGLPGIWYAGSHGFELTGPDGEHHQNDAAAAAIPVLEEAAAELRGQLDAISGVGLEQKRFGVAVHYRNTARERVGEVLAAVRAVGEHFGLRVTTGREVIELRPDVDWDKGKTLRWVLDQIRDAESAALKPIFLGDDITDEDAFDAVHDDGVGIVVRHSDDGDRATAAGYALDSPAEVTEFTERLAQQIGAETGS